MVLPSDFRQENFHAHDPRERALDFHVKAGQDWNAPPVIAVLIGIPWIPAAAKVCGIGCSGGRIGVRRAGICAAAPLANKSHARMIAINRRPTRWTLLLLRFALIRHRHPRTGGKRPNQRTSSTKL